MLDTHDRLHFAYCVLCDKLEAGTNSISYCDIREQQPKLQMLSHELVTEFDGDSCRGLTLYDLIVKRYKTKTQ